MMKKILFLLPLLAILLYECRHEPVEKTPEGALTLESSPQRTGNAATGYQYITEGGYMNSGIPLGTYQLVFGNNNTNDLGRTGDNRGVFYEYTVSTAPNGVKVVSQNCLSCHATKLNGKTIVGLGNNLLDNSNSQVSTLNTLELAIRFQYGANSPAWTAYETYGKALRAVAPVTSTTTLGANPADKVFAVIAAHRNAKNLTWLDKPQYVVPAIALSTDVPAWWLMKKKATLYYNGLGQGDFARLMMTASLLTMRDSTEAAAIDAQFVHVLAWLKTVQPPKYPYPIEPNSVALGETIFNQNCTKCHGTYGSNPAYPNYLIDIQTINTDPALMNAYKANPEYANWFNDSWFGQGAYAGRLRPQTGYIAPPLDGVWATAPYLHNGSVPTLDDLLNSRQRPAIWRYTQVDNSDYDAMKLGWKYTTPSSKSDNQTYDTGLYGNSNGGHLFGDLLSETERKALLEYLKTL
jgi:mono/diheme cytochrome c family protein